jgi:uncharacterized protein YwgA
MTKHQLARLVAWAGALDTRKRFQKLVYLLQAAGCPLEAEYRPHYHGPYSHEVARLVDELVGQGLLEETCSLTAGGRRFSYALSETARARLREYEATPAGQAAVAALEPFQPLLGRLLATDLDELELASSIVFERQRGEGWPRAAETARFLKSEPPGSAAVQQALELARSVIP